MRRRMQPDELNPLARLAESEIRLEDVVLSSATFLMWERLYSVATVSPTAERMALYILDQRPENRRMDGLLGAQCKRDVSPWYPRTALDAVATCSDASLAVGSCERPIAASSLSSPHKSCGVAPHRQAHEEIYGGKNSLFALDDRSAQPQHGSARYEHISSLEDVQSRKRSRDGDDVDCVAQAFISSHPPLVMTPPSSSQETGGSRSWVCGSLFPTESPFRTVADGGATRQFYNGGVEEARSEERVMMKTAVAAVDAWPRLSQMSDVLKLDDDNDDNDGENTEIGHHIVRGSSGSCLPLPDSTRVTGTPVPSEPQLQGLAEACHATEERGPLIIQTPNDGRSVSLVRLQNVGSNDKNAEGPDVAIECIPVLGDGCRVEFSSGQLLWCGGATSASLSSPPWPPLSGADEEVTTQSKSVSQPEVLREAVQKKARRYQPPPFCTTSLPSSIDGAHSARVNGSGSLPPSVLQTCNSVLSPAMATARDYQNGATSPASLCRSPSVPSGPLPFSSVFTTPLPKEERLFSLPADEAFLHSSSSAFIQGVEYEGRRSSEKDADARICGDGNTTICPLSSGGRKQTSHPKTPQEEVFDEYQPQDGLEIKMSVKETNVTSISVSPSPSQKDYMWAERAQEALEQQQKRFLARTPSTNPLSIPPPLQVGGFDLPHMPMSRYPSHEAALDEEGNRACTESPQATKGVSQCLLSSPDGIISTTKSSATRILDGSLSQTVPTIQCTAARKRQTLAAAAATEAPSAVKKRLQQRGAVSPPPPSTPEFPLPRQVVPASSATTPTTMQGRKKIKRGRNERRK